MLALLSARKADAEADKAKGAAAGPAEDKSEEEVFCKICGLKETREKLMEHVYGHLVGKEAKKILF